MTIDLREVMNGLAIKRYHTKRTIREQTVADHSARICAILCYLMDNQPTAAVLQAAIYHDCSEFVTGDIPAPAKWNNPALKTELSRITTEYEVSMGLRVVLTDREAKLLKFADLAEGCQYCIDELQLGNRNLLPTLSRYLKALRNAPKDEYRDVHFRQLELIGDFDNYLSYSRNK